MSAYQPYPKYKDSGVEWLGEVPKGWEVKPLKVVASFNDDVLPEGFGEDEEIEYVDIGSVSLEAGIERTETFRFGEAPSRARRRVRDGDVIASTVRTYLKAIAPVVAPPANLIVSTGFAVIRPRNDLDSHFAKFSLQSGYFVDEVISRSTGVSYPAINASEMAAIALALPPLPEQRQIATFLNRECGKLDALQAKQERLIELLKEKRQALISHAVTKGLDPTAKLKPSGIEWLGNVPEAWVVPYIGVLIAKAELGGNYDGSEGEDGIPLIKMGNLDRGFIKMNKVESLPEGQVYDRAFVLRDGDFLFNTRNSLDLVGKVAIWRSELPLAIYNSNILRITFRKQKVATSAFMSYFFNSDLGVSQLRLVAKGTTSVAAIYYKDLTTLRVPLPPLAEQRAIVAHLNEKCEKIDQLMAKAERAIELLKERRSALISAAVTGKIDVREK